ncbi:MAG: hypothetical protein COX77_04140 [Candidatus Komeilibacteria bacterium CG_4_10_14_0_2_um_filter_37_10]|uniref:Methyltransferase type 11 domain-containing protein n=1 Tax=Candidatus Komeilibacteria bacterium CG_4_10_14_0_2_um_filter_37_10 TaxID=1974470 RepID=A0A2M7VDP2_9BACT|nr:MAG: hypothetical protein COX77_04140 [Candidatus Komeilibacteria bacterium CG_4_10_14_0_2_um_filter_37_10]
MKQLLINKIQDQVVATYCAIADTFSQSRQSNWPIAQVLAKKIKPNNIVLDWGCGNGRFYPLVADYQGQYYGMDNCRLLLEKAQAQYGVAHWLNEQDAWPAAIDLIYALASFHHLPGRQARQELLQKFYQHLNPGGYLLMTTWNLRQKKYFWLWLKSNFINIFRSYDLNDVLVPWHGQTETIWRYCHNFNPRELRLLVEKSGLVIEELYYERAGQVTNQWHGHNLVLVARKL